MQILPTPPSPTESATGAIDPKWHLAYSGFGLLGLIILAAFGTFFAMVYLRAKQIHPLGEYSPSSYEDFERAYRLTRPPPRRKWWRVLGENFCCCFGIWAEKPEIHALLMEEGRFPPDPVPPAAPAAPAAPVPPVAPAGQTTGGTGAPGGQKGVKAWIEGILRKPKSP